MLRLDGEGVEAAKKKLDSIDKMVADITKKASEGYEMTPEMAVQMGEDWKAALELPYQQLSDFGNAVRDGLGMATGESNLTGISKAVGELTEDAALTLAAVANSQLFYTIGNYNNSVAMLAIMTKWDALFSGGEGLGFVPAMLKFQSDVLGVIQAIKADTARIATATESTANSLGSVISPLNSRTGSHGINMN